MNDDKKNEALEKSIKRLEMRLIKLERKIIEDARLIKTLKYKVLELENNMIHYVRRR